MDNTPSITARGLDLEKHVRLSKVNPGLVVVWGNPIFKSNRAEMVKLVIEHVRDIIGDSLIFVPHEPREAEDSPGGEASVKLCIESVPVGLGRGNTLTIFVISVVEFFISILRYTTTRSFMASSVSMVL